MAATDSRTGLVWLRRDLRLADNPAIQQALASCDKVLLTYIWPADEQNYWEIGAASRYWLGKSLKALEKSIHTLGGHLHIAIGEPSTILIELCKSTCTRNVYWHRLYEPHLLRQDKMVEIELGKEGISCETLPGNLLLEPWETTKADGKPYQVFTAFAKNHREINKPHPLVQPPGKINGIIGKKSLKIDDLGLAPTIQWTNGIDEAWKPGEAGARTALRDFLKSGLQNYDKTRDFPALPHGVSRLSPHLHFGEISVREVWNRVSELPKTKKNPGSETTYQNELLWREFSHHLLYYFSGMPDKSLKSQFGNYPWEHNEKLLKAWQKGLTGYPIVDAGMRQLWQTGWMHNRVRMIVGSFLVKDLNIAWQTGEEWFWDTLVDADLAQNAMNWQWVAGCGADAAPFFRIFNPTLQGKKFDPDGSYVRTFVPELAKLPARWIHEPSTAPADVLNHCNIKLGKTYPNPIIDHSVTRQAALHAYKKLR